MTDTTRQPDKSTRLYFKSYLRLIHNAVDSHMFRNFYVETPEQGVFDALDDGSNSCAFFVSSVLILFKKLEGGIHGTVASTIRDLELSGWQLVDAPQAGDVLVWEAKQFDDGLKQHIGFSIGDGKAISTSASTRTPVRHDQNFGKANRKITHIYRILTW
jgi:hypothetical protein